jgi:hypothetical protein
LRWLVDSEELRLDAPDLDMRLERAVRGCWFGSITDMDIGAFCRVNGIKGQDLRPDWKSLGTFASVDRIRDWMAHRELTRMVLIEDFVGSGRQATDTLCWLGENLSDVPILFCAILICPPGFVRLLKVTRRWGINFATVFQPNERMILSSQSRPDEPNIHQRARELAIRLHGRVRGGRFRPRNPMGFESTGALIVMHTNCPNNAPPIIHNDSTTWEALFPRAAR